MAMRVPSLCRRFPEPVTSIIEFPEPYRIDDAELWHSKGAC